MSRDLLPLFDLARRWPDLRDSTLQALERVAQVGDFTLGAELSLFEAEYAAYCGVEHCVGVANGTVAIELALRALGVGPGQEVVTVAHTFVATVEAIAATGATPVLVDIEAATYCMDPAALERVISERTTAVVPVHLYGRPAPIEEIRAICDHRGVALVEDAAQAHGATLGGRRAGSLGTAGCFSFYPTKNLGALGDGGAVVTDRADVAATVRSLSHHGSARDDANRHERPGRTERLDNLQAAFLRIKLRSLDRDNEERRDIALRYRRRLADLPLTLPPEDPDDIGSVASLFVIEVHERDRVRDSLRAAGIATGVHYPTPIHLQPAWRHLGYRERDLPASEHAARRVLSLPAFAGLRARELEQVCTALERAVGRVPLTARR